MDLDAMPQSVKVDLQRQAAEMTVPKKIIKFVRIKRTVDNISNILGKRLLPVPQDYVGYLPTSIF